MSSLFEQIGGREAVNTAVVTFYGHILADDRIAHFFEGVDMEKQKNKQKAFLMMAFGGPNQYTGKNLRDGHAHLVAKGLDDSHFDAVAENLVKTLKELDVPQDLIGQVLEIVGPTRDDVLGRTAPVTTTSL